MTSKMTPKTPDELAQAIDALVTSYVGEARRVAQSALDDAFSRAVASRRPTGARGRLQRPERRATSTGRRSPDEMSDSVEKLYAVVCAHPGESMTVFASELELPVQSLRRPMSKLRAQGRVRSVGERNMTRYFPALGRRAKTSDT